MEKYIIIMNKIKFHKYISSPHWFNKILLKSQQIHYVYMYM